MSFRKLNTLLCMAFTALAVVSCSDDDDDITVAPSLDGSLTFSINKYILQGETVKMTPTGLSHPKDAGIGYKWKVTPSEKDTTYTTRFENGLSAEDKESDGSFIYDKFDELTTYTISCTAFANGYSSSYKSASIIVVKPGPDGSLTDTGINAEDQSMEIGGIKYYHTVHDGLDWMRNNLTNNEFGIPYADSDIMNEIFGRFYSYEDAAQACPEGWRLPTDEDWRKLAAGLNGKETAEAYATIPDIASSLMADAKFNQDKMWKYWPSVGDITNMSRLSVLPLGYVNLGTKKDGKYPTASFQKVYEYATFWVDTPDEVLAEGMAYYRYLICDEPGMYVGKADARTFGANVRCVRNSR